MKTLEAMLAAPVKGDLRVWNIVNPPNKPTYRAASSPDHAIQIIDSMAAAQLKDDSIFCNAFGLEVYEDGEWCEWYSEDGDDIDEYAIAKEATP